MPTPGKRWYHVTFGTHNSWLPGDPRGFRSRGYKLHSSGEHRNPPPMGEHAGLHRYAKSISGEPILLSVPCRKIAGKAVIKSLSKHGHQLLVLAVGGMHVHLLAELPMQLQAVKDAIGYAKVSASMRLKGELPGKVWAKGCNLKPIRDHNHQSNTFEYIKRHRLEGAWVWTFRGGVVSEGV